MHTTRRSIPTTLLSALVLATALLPLSATLAAQTPAPQTPAAEKPADPAAKPATAQPKTAAPAIPERYRDPRDVLSTDALLAELKARYPGIDPATKHRLNDIQNPKDKNERYDYTTNMMRVVDLWIETGNGATLEKLLDEQLAAKREQAVYRCVAGYFFTRYPPGSQGSNAAFARTNLDSALDLDKDFEVPAALLAMHYLAIYEGAKAGTAADYADRALKSRPDYPDALLAKTIAAVVRKQSADVLATAKILLAIGTAEDAKWQEGASYAANATPQAERAAFLNQLAASGPTESKRAIAQSLFAEHLLDEKKFDDAISLADTAAKRLDPASSAAAILDLHLDVTYAALSALARDARAKDDTAAVTALQARAEKLLRDLVALDLKYLSPGDDNHKLEAPIRLARFLAFERKNLKEATAFLREYDKLATRLTSRQRMQLRQQIEELAGPGDGNWPVPLMKEKLGTGQSADRADVAKRLEDIFTLAKTNGEKYRLDDAAMLEFLLTVGLPCTDRTVARWAAACLGIAAVQKGDEATKQKARDALLARIKAETAVDATDVQFLVREVLDALERIGGVASARAILAYADAFTGMKELDSDPGKLIRKTIAPMILRLAALDKDAKLKDDAGNIFSPAELKKWLADVRTKLPADPAPAADPKPASDKPADPKPADPSTPVPAK
jgi:hypothetical protein